MATPKTETAATPSTPKRKRKTVESNLAKVWKPENVGDMLEGKYVGSETVKGKGDRKDFTSYHFLQDDGERVRLSSAMLNNKMNQVPIGTYCWLTYTGMFKTDNGESPDYNVEVEDGTKMIDPYANVGA